MPSDTSRCQKDVVDTSVKAQLGGRGVAWPHGSRIPFYQRPRTHRDRGPPDVRFCSTDPNL